MFHPLSQRQPIVSSLIKRFFGGLFLCLPGELLRLQSSFSTIVCSKMHAIKTDSARCCSALPKIPVGLVSLALFSTARGQEPKALGWNYWFAAVAPAAFMETSFSPA